MILNRITNRYTYRYTPLCCGKQKHLELRATAVRLTSSGP